MPRVPARLIDPFGEFQCLLSFKEPLNDTIFHDVRRHGVYH